MAQDSGPSYQQITNKHLVLAMCESSDQWTRLSPVRDLSDLERFKRTVCATLGKLTVENSDKLAGKLVEQNLQTIEKLETLGELIVRKALLEAVRLDMYVGFILTLQRLDTGLVAIAVGGAQTVSFSDIVCSKC